jgi:hypothetical protein
MWVVGTAEQVREAGRDPGELPPDVIVSKLLRDVFFSETVSFPSED